MDGLDGAQGAQGPQGPQGPKAAVVPYTVQGQTKYLGLSCVESPQVWFTDVMTAQLEAYQTEVPIDPRFVGVCERDSLKVTGVVPSDPVLVGAFVADNHLVLRSPGFQAKPRVVATLAGIRREYAAFRFEEYTEEQAKRNNAFWNTAWKDTDK
jgi:hypothetical protein